MYRKFVYGNQKERTIFFFVRNTFYANFLSMNTLRSKYNEYLQLKLKTRNGDTRKT